VDLSPIIPLEIQRVAVVEVRENRREREAACAVFLANLESVIVDMVTII